MHAATKATLYFIEKHNREVNEESRKKMIKERHDRFQEQINNEEQKRKRKKDIITDLQENYPSEKVEKFFKSNLSQPEKWKIADFLTQKLSLYPKNISDSIKKSDLDLSQMHTYVRDSEKGIELFLPSEQKIFRNSTLSLDERMNISKEIITELRHFNSGINNPSKYTFEVGNESVIEGHKKLMEIKDIMKNQSNEVKQSFYKFQDLLYYAHETSKSLVNEYKDLAPYKQVKIIKDSCEPYSIKEAVIELNKYPKNLSEDFYHSDMCFDDIRLLLNNAKFYENQTSKLPLQNNATMDLLIGLFNVPRTKDGSLQSISEMNNNYQILLERNTRLTKVYKNTNEELKKAEGSLLSRHFGDKIPSLKEKLEVIENRLHQNSDEIKPYEEVASYITKLVSLDKGVKSQQKSSKQELQMSGK